MAGPEKNKGRSAMNYSDDPPSLSITNWKLSDLPQKRKGWSADHLPVDILLLTVEDCELLACYYYLRDSFKSYHRSIGDVYFGNMSGEGDESLRVALVKCSKESLDPGGAQTTAKNAVTLLKPKATFLVGFSYSPSFGKAQRGDVVISSTLTTKYHQTPVSRNVGTLIKTAAHGWKAPLGKPEAQEVKVHCDGKIWSHTDLNGAEQQCQLHSGAIVVEMEGKGLFAAAYDLKTEWVVVKGVCDFVHGSGSTNDSWKTFACVMAASVVSKMLSDSFVFENWPNWGDISAREESCNSDDSSNKRRKVEEPLNVKKCKDHLKSHYDTFSTVKIVPWDDSSSIQINEIYTPLYWVRHHRTPREVTKVELGDYTNMFQEDGYHGNPRRLLVYGPPGIGKSTFCKKVAYDWSKALKEILKNFHLLLLLKLQDVCDLKDIRDVLNASKLLARDCPISFDSLYDYIINHQDKVIFILDGFDEYSCAKEHSPILEIWRGEQLRDCHVIVTTRYLEGNELSRLSCVQFEIQGFKGWKRIRNYANKFLASEEDVEEFKSYLKEKGLKDMAEIPLLLLMLCVLWNEKHHEGLPTSRSDIYTEFIQTMLNHKAEKEKSVQFQKVTSKEFREDLSNLGKVALDALLQGHPFIRCSKLPDNISRTIEKLREVGLFQIVNTTSLNPEKGAYFIHKSVQEFLAAWHMKEEVLSMKGDSMTSLSRLESVEKILKVIEVLKFACELSTEAACTVFHHVGSVGEKELSLDSELSELIQSTLDLSWKREAYLTLMSHSYFCCSPEKRQDLYSMFLSYTGGVMLLDSNQLNIVSKEHLLKSSVAPKSIIFSDVDKYSEKGYQDLITVAEDVKAVVMSSLGEKKAADFLRRHAVRPLNEFFFRKIGKISLYIGEIHKAPWVNVTFPTEILRELIASTAESTQDECISDQLDEHINGTASCLTGNTDGISGQTPHSLSYMRLIACYNMEREEMKTLVDSLPLVTSLDYLDIDGDYEFSDTPPLSEALVSCIKFTDRLDTLALQNINLTAAAAAIIARSLPQAPNLGHLDLSSNPISEAVSDLIQHLSCCPDLETLDLTNIKMTKEQIYDLNAAVRRSSIFRLRTEYHDVKGNVKPEDEWWTRDGIKIGPDTDSEDEHESGSVFD